LRRFCQDEELLVDLAAGLGVPREEVVPATERLLQQRKDLQKELDRLRLKMAGSSDGADQAEQVDDLQVLARRVQDLDRGQMRQLADGLKEKADVVVLGTRREERVALLVAVRDEVAGRVPARQLVDRLARLCGGRGGGKATLAEAGGGNPEGLDEALGQSGQAVREILAGGETT
jgi:alanyl-tRNA synthetase